MRLSRLVVAAALLFCPTLLPALDAPRIVIDPPRWDYGSVVQGAVTETTVTVANQGATAVTVTFVPTCTCLEAVPTSRTIDAGGRASFTLRFNTVDDIGITTRGFIVRVDPAGTAPLYYTLSGVVRGVSRGAGAGAGDSGAPRTGEAATGPGLPIVTADYYYTPGCRSCEEFLSVTLPRLAAAHGVSVAVRRRDVLQPAAYEDLARRAEAGGVPLREVPALDIAGVLLQGDAAIATALPGLLAVGNADGPNPAWKREGAAPAPGSSLALGVLPVLAAGLLDGINPCAFTTLVFLLAALALAGRGRREILIIGGLFSAAVFATYFLVGMGLFAALRAANVVPLGAALLRWALVAVLAVFAALSVYDYTLVRRGRSKEMLLQLPAFLKRRIHDSIRVTARSGLLVASSLLLGFLVSIFEFACTGQVYLPTLAYLARQPGRSDAVGLLVLYNAAFIVPLLVVFAASYAGTGQARLVAFFQRRLGAVKIGLAILFAGLAVLTLVG
jgi:cytochrome c biogenesis protein CcdA